MERWAIELTSPRRIPTNCSAKAEQLAQKMYNAVKTKDSSFIVRVENWMTMYNQDIQTALVTFVLFVFRCAGAKMPQEIIAPNLRIPKEMVTYASSNRSICNMTISKKGEIVENIASRMQLEQMWTAIWEEAVECDAAFDGCLFETVLEFLKAMTESNYDIFSHTCAFLAMRLMPNMEKTRLDLEVAITEKSYFPRRSPSSYKETRDFESHSILLEGKMNKLTNLLQITFQIFEKSSRDKLWKIRELCLMALGEVLLLSPIMYQDQIDYLCQAMGDRLVRVRLLALSNVHELTCITHLARKMTVILTELKPIIHELSLAPGCKSAMPYLLKLLTFLYKQRPDEFSTRDADVLFDIIVESKTYPKLVEDTKRLLVKYLSAGEGYPGFNDKEKVILNLAKYVLTNDSPTFKLGKWLYIFKDLSDLDFVYGLWMKVTSCYPCRQSTYAVTVLDIIIANFKEENLKVYKPMPDAIEFLENGLRFCEDNATLIERLLLSAWYFVFPYIDGDTLSEEYEQFLDILDTLLKKHKSNFEIFKSCLHLIDRLFKAKCELAGYAYERMKKELTEEYVETVHRIMKTGICWAPNVLIVNKVEMLLRYTCVENDVLLHATFTLLENAPRNQENMVGVIGLAQTIIWLTLSASLSQVLDVPNQDVAEGLKMKCKKFLQLCCEFLAHVTLRDTAFEHVCRVLKYFCKGLEKHHPSLAILAIDDDDPFIVPLNNYVKKKILSGGPVSFEKGVLKSYWDLVQQGTIPVGKTDEVVKLAKLQMQKK